MNDFHIYRTTGGESLVDIAATFTLSGEYAPALANFNGFDAFQAGANYAFGPGELVAIPDNWIAWKQLSDIGKAALTLPPGKTLEVTITGSGGKASAPAVTSSPAAPATRTNWLMLGLIGLGLFMFSTKGNFK